MFPNISKYACKGNWKEYGVRSWNDLLRDTFGKVNVAHKNWTGKEGLNRAKKELENYFNVHQKLPTSRMISKIPHVASRGYWKEYNIRSWNDLLRDMFGKLNRMPRNWRGKEGLDRAKKML